MDTLLNQSIEGQTLLDYNSNETAIELISDRIDAMDAIAIVGTESMDEQLLQASVVAVMSDYGEVPTNIVGMEFVYTTIVTLIETLIKLLKQAMDIVVKWWDNNVSRLARIGKSAGKLAKLAKASKGNPKKQKLSAVNPEYIFTDGKPIGLEVVGLKLFINSIGLLTKEIAMDTYILDAMIAAPFSMDTIRKVSTVVNVGVRSRVAEVKKLDKISVSKNKTLYRDNKLVLPGGAYIAYDISNLANTPIATFVHPVRDDKGYPDIDALTASEIVKLADIVEKGAKSMIAQKGTLKAVKTRMKETNVYAKGILSVIRLGGSDRAIISNMRTQLAIIGGNLYRPFQGKMLYGTKLLIAVYKTTLVAYKNLDDAAKAVPKAPESPETPKTGQHALPQLK